jgi:two-component sensor histidine kinase
MADIGASLEGGGQLHGFEQRIRCKDGSYRWINWSSTPVPEENLLFGVGRDVTERREFDRQRDIFIAELNHRVKNTLAVVQAMASQTFRVEGGDPSAAIAKYQKRISAIALAHDLLTNNNWGVVSLGELVRGALGRAREKAHQIEVEGPELFVSPRQAVAFSLALNELLENSRAHGSLKAPSGRVSITWMHEDCDRFSFIWQESGSTARAAPEGPGFGTLLLRSLGEEFDGASRMEFGTGGVAFRLTGNAQN